MKWLIQALTGCLDKLKKPTQHPINGYDRGLLAQIYFNRPFRPLDQMASKQKGLDNCHDCVPLARINYNRPFHPLDQIASNEQKGLILRNRLIYKTLFQLIRPIPRISLKQYHKHFYDKHKSYNNVTNTAYLRQKQKGNLKKKKKRKKKQKLQRRDLQNRRIMNREMHRSPYKISN